MNSHERVARAVSFRTPDRIPLARGAHNDFGGVGWKPARGFQPDRPGRNEWGVRWHSLNAGQGDQGQVAEHPLADWERRRDYRFPDPAAPGRFEHLPAALAEQRRAGLFVVGHLGKGPMHLLDDLRGFENYLVDLLESPGRVEWLLEGIFDVLAGLLDRFLQAGVDAVHLTDDQAMQSGPLFSMSLWRRFLKPRYRALFARAHAGGALVFMHTCGNLAGHLIDLREAGVDLVDNKQPALWMDSPAVDAVRGRLAFSTCLDIQAVMPRLPREEVESETGRLVRRLATPAGGFVGTWYDKPDLGLDPLKIESMRRAFVSFKW